MTRMTVSAMTIVAAIMAAGCAMELPSSADEGAGPEQRRTSLLSPLDTANVLLFGDQVMHLNVLRAHLQQLGHTVTILPGFGLPSTVDELAQFQTVWHVGRNVALTPAQQALLAEYLSIGGAVHLTGEGSGAAVSNAALTTFVRSVVRRSNRITIGDPVTVPGPNDDPFYPVNEDAPGDVANWPNSVRTLEMLDVGGIGGLRASSPNALVMGGRRGRRVVGAIWDSEDLVADAGKLSIIMDAEWLLSANGANDNAELIQNLQEYLSAAPFAD